MPKTKADLFRILQRGGLDGDAIQSLVDALSSDGEDQFGGYLGSQQLASGEETFPRLMGTVSTVNTVIASQVLCLSYFTARKTEQVNNLAMSTAATAAGATPTLCRMGLYEIASNGDGTLVASCANDTALFAAAFTRYSRATTVAYTKRSGQRYAFGTLVVTGAAMPNFTACGMQSGSSATLAVAPRLTAAKTGQSDLPSSFTDASLAANAYMVYGEALP